MSDSSKSEGGAGGGSSSINWLIAGAVAVGLAGLAYFEYSKIQPSKPTLKRREHQPQLELKLSASEAEKVAEWQKLAKQIEIANGRKDYELSEKFLVRGIATLSSVIGDDHLLLALTWQSLAFAQKEQGKFAEAIAAYDQVVRIYTLDSGGVDLDAAEVMVSMADCYISIQKYDEAQALLQHALAVFALSDDPEGINTAATHDILATIAEARGQYKEALDLLGKAHRMFKAAGYLSPAAGSLIKTAQHYRTLDDFDNAMKTYEALSTLLKASPKYDPTNPLEYSAVYNTGTLLMDYGRETEGMAKILEVANMDVSPPNSYSRFLSTNLSLFVFALPPEGSAGAADVPKAAYVHCDLNVNVNAWKAVARNFSAQSKLLLKGTLTELGPQKITPLTFEAEVTAEEATEPIKVNSMPFVPRASAFLYIIEVWDPLSDKKLGTHYQVCRSPIDLNTATAEDIRVLARSPNTIHNRSDQ